MLFENRTHAPRIIAIVILVMVFMLNTGVVICVAVSMAQEETTVGELNSNYYETIRLNQTIQDAQEILGLKEGASELYSDEPEVFEEEVIVEEEPVDKMAIEEYIVQPGDSLWRIAKMVYGDGSLYESLIELNGLKDEYSYIYAGQTIKYYVYEYTASAVSVQYSEAHKDDPVPQKTTTTKSAKNGNSSDNMTYVGKFFITGYDAYCSHCCGKSNGITASGTQATVGRTIATSKQFSFGTKLYIEGYGTYIVEDRGVSNGTIDIVAESHEACYDLTRHNVNVYIVND